MKKFLVLSVMLTMVVWTMGAAFVPSASAATLSAGDLIKASGPAVYYYAADGQRYTFPTQDTYMTWYSDFSGVKTITDDELAAIDLAGNVVFRAGTKLVKIATVPKVFAVEPNGQLVWVKTEAVAKALYGDNWNKMISIVPDGFWTNYTDSGSELDGTAYPEGTLVKMAGSADTYRVGADGKWSKIATEAAFNANMFNWNYVVTAPAGFSMTAGSDITGLVSTYVDVSQGGGAGTGTTPTGSGTLTVALAGDTPAASPVADAATANFTKFSLTATGSAVEVSKIVVTKGGYSSTSDLENIKITDLSGVLLTNSASLNSAGTATLTFSPALSLAAGETRYFYVKAGVVNNTTAGKTMSFAISASSDVTSSAASVAGNFPVQGNAMNVVQVDIGSASVTNDGTVTDTTPDAGDENVVVNKFRVEAGTTEAITIESLSVMETGTAALSDVKNIELWSVTENKSLGTVDSYNANGKASFTGLNITVGKGEIYRFTVRVDIVSGAGQTTNSDLTDGSDVLMSVKGNSYGFYITPTVTGGWNGQGASAQTINSGSLVVSKSAATPATGNITEAPDQVLAVWDLEARGESIQVSQFKVAFTYDGGAVGDGGDLISCKLYDNSMTLVAGPVDGTDANDYVNFTDTFIVPVGTWKYTLKCRVFDSDSDDFAGTATFRAGVTPSTGMAAKGYTTNDTLSFAAQASNVQGNILTVSTATLSATTLGTPAAQSVAAGTDDFIWATFSLDANNSGEDINVTGLVLEDTLNLVGSDAGDIDNVEIWCDVDSSSSSRGDVYEKKLTNNEEFTDTGALDETLSMSFTETLLVKKNSFVKCAVVADLANGATAGEIHTISLDTDAGDVTATGATTGATVTVTPTGAGQAMTVATSGDVTLTVDSSSPKAAIFVGGETAQTLAVFRLTANSVESTDLDSIKITDDGVGADAGVENDNVATYYFYSNKRSDGGSVSDPIASKPGGPTAEVFLADGTVTVPANGYVLITVKGDLNLVDGTSIQNGDSVEVTVDASGDIDTTGLSSGVAIDPDDTAVDAATHLVYEARPEVTKDSSSPSGTLGTGANTLVAVFKIDNSDGADDVTFINADGNTVTLQFSPNATAGDAGAERVVVRDKNGNELFNDNVTYDIDNGTATKEVIVDFASLDLVVPAGEYELLKIYADTTGFTTAGDSLQVWLDAVAADIDWSVDSDGGNYQTGVITLRGGVYGNALGK